MSNGSNNSPLEDLQNFLEDFKDQYGNNVQFNTEFVDEPNRENTTEPSPEPDQDWSLDFDYTPSEVRDHLNQYVIGQNEAKKHLSNAVCYHYHQTTRDDEFYQKKNILMIGNTGVGKTHLVEILSDLIGVPFVKADATKFSGTGYVGKNVTSLVRELFEKADQNRDKAEHGIVFIDEIDKICAQSERDRDVSGKDVQTNLLKLLEETEISLTDPSNPMSMMQGMQQMFGDGQGSGDPSINTRKILFIVSGAFPGLEEIITKRLDRGGIGFNAEVDQSRDVEVLRRCSVQDLIDYGLEAEFVARLPVRTYLHDLDRDDLYRILTESKSSILHQYQRDFEAYDINLDVTENALRLIADRAMDEEIGARGLTSVLEEILFEFMHRLPDGPTDQLTVTENLVENPRQHLRKRVLDTELDPYLEEHFADFSGTLEVTESGRHALLEVAAEQDRDPLSVFQERFDSLHHILNMIEFDRLEIDASFVHNHEEELDQLCSDYYQK